MVGRDAGAALGLLHDLFVAYGRRGFDGVAVDHYF